MYIWAFLVKGQVELAPIKRFLPGTHGCSIVPNGMPSLQIRGERQDGYPTD